MPQFSVSHRRLVLATFAAIGGLTCFGPASADMPAPAIKLNQLGFLPGASKVAVVAQIPALPTLSAAGASSQQGSGAAPAEYTVVQAGSDRIVQRGKLGAAMPAPDAGETVRLVDFSGLRTPGRYQLRVAGVPDSLPFEIKADAYQDLNAGAIRAYYLNRAGIALDRQHAGLYARAAGHADTSVQVHPSAASATRPAGTVIASPKGWYDAGDYNKYIVNSGITTYTLLAAYEDYPQFFQQQKLNIPESGNGIPDLLNEALWNLAWMLTMQDPADGGVYHKLTDKQFDGYVMPAQARQQRYVVQKTTAAALDFAAVMATASRVLAPLERQLEQQFKQQSGQQPGQQSSQQSSQQLQTSTLALRGLSARMLAAAQAAWQWAQAHPAEYYQQPQDIKTGEYGDKDVSDEFAWAAAELFITTGDANYYQAMQRHPAPVVTPSWGEVRALGWLSLARHRQHLNPIADHALIAERVGTLAQGLLANWKKSPYRITMSTADYIWGSNAVVLNQAMVLAHAYRLTGQRDYLDAAQSGLDYVLGRNAVDLSFVTGFGARAAMHPHHRPSEADGIAAPVPGFVVGGPQPGQQDKKDCKARYASALPARSYLDDACSYASNEIAINWNAPLVYVSAALQVLTPAARP